MSKFNLTIKRSVPLQLRRNYVSAAEAMKILNVRPQTLYAYVSRGWIRSIPQKGLKDKLYLREDVTRMEMRSLARSGHGAVAASAMNWGEPIFPTSITEITDQGPRYRSHLAAELVRSGASFETVATALDRRVQRGVARMARTQTFSRACQTDKDPDLAAGG